MFPPNQAILMTPPGTAAIAVIRLTGRGVTNFLQKYFSRPVPPGQPTHGTLADGTRIIDDPVIVRLEDNRGADLNLHGGAWVIHEVLDLARREGFNIFDNPALPLSLDATDGQTLLEREIESHLPLARTELALEVLLSQKTAWENLRTQGWSENLRQSILSNKSLYWLLHPPHVAIVGIANVGKSTLANQLFAQERSITADLPGTTRDWVGEIANLDGLPIMLLDTPGLRPTTDPIEQLAITQSTPIIQSADLIVLVLDATQPLEEQSQLIRTYPTAIIVTNKSDRPGAWNQSQLKSIPTIATTGQGIDQLRQSIRTFFHCENINPNDSHWWTPRQHSLLTNPASDNILDQIIS